MFTLKTAQPKRIVSLLVATVLLLTVCLTAPLTASAATVSVTVNNSGTVSTIDAAVGEELPRPERINGMTFLGWYSDPELTVEYGKVQVNETRQAYAKYPKTLITFEQKTAYTINKEYRDDSDSRSGATYKSGVITDPADSSNKVFKLHSPAIWSNILLPQYETADASGYALTAGHSYTVSFKYKLPETVTADLITIRLLEGNAGKGAGTMRKPFDNTKQAVDPQSDSVSTGVWYTYTDTITASSNTLSPMLSILFDTDDDPNNSYDADDAYAVANYILIDNVTVTDNTAMADIVFDNTYTSFEGCEVSYSNGFNSTSAAVISDEEARTGEQSLKIAPAGTNHYRAYAYNGIGSAIKLESYTKYNVSFWYKATKLTDNNVNTDIYLERTGKASVWSNMKTLTSTNITNAVIGEWTEVEVSFVTGDCSDSCYLSVDLYGSVGDVVYFDDFTVTPVKYVGLTDYYCDFDADFSFYGNPTSDTSWKYYASKVNYNTDKGILYFPTPHSTAPSETSAVYVQHFAPYDGGTFFQFKSNTSYRVVVRYKQTAADENNVGYFSIGTKSVIPGSEGIKSLAVIKTTGTTDWKEATLQFTAGDLGNSKYLTLTFGSKNGSLVEFEVDYINIAEGPFCNNNGEITKITTAAGSAIPEPSHSADLTFMGWFSDIECTKPYGNVQTGETRQAYAKYNKTVLTFGEKGFTSSRGNVAVTVTDPDDLTNKTVYLPLEDYWATLEPSSYDDKGATYYKLSPYCDYTVEFDYRLTPGLTDDLKIRINSGTVANYNASYPKYIYNETEKTISASEYATGWNTYKTTFNSGSLTNGDHLFLCAIIENTIPSGYGIYIDNIKIYNSSEFETVTLNNRGVISTIDCVVGQTLPALRSLDEQNFIGWYSDPECTMEFGAVQANETRKAYAKYDTVKISFIPDSNVPGLTSSGNNWFAEISSGNALTVPSYDAADAKSLKLSADTTYVVRFIYKVLPGSAAGKFSILGNELAFDAAHADTTWAAGAVTFTTASAEELQLSVVSDGAANVYVDDLLIYAVTKTPDTSVKSGSSTITATAPIARNNMQTGTVSINLSDGEQLKVNGLTVSYDLYATAFSEPVTSSVMLSTGAYDFDGNNVPGNGSEFVYMVPASAKNIRIEAEFISADETNIGIIAGSIRKKTDTLNSGIRFRGRVYNDVDIAKIGFILAPEKLVTGAGFDSLTLDNADACSAVKADATGTIYDATDCYTDYQVILTGMDKLLATDIQCVMYIEYANGTVKYADAVTQSYNSLVSAMNVVHRGITSFYSDEYDDTRNKLIQNKTYDGFSFIMLSDTHIDYTHSVKDGEYWYNGTTCPSRITVQREIAAAIELANTSDVDCIILGGDIIHGISSYADSMADLQYYADVFSKSKVPVYVNRGNHDANDYHGTPCPITHIIDQEDWVTTLLDPASKNTAVHAEDDANSTYYYVDFASKKTRLIVLDPYNYPVTSSDGYYCDWTAESWTGIEDAQLRWLAQVALDAEKQGWTYVLSMHPPIYGPESFRNNTLVQNIVTAFNNKTTVTVNGWTVDYTNVDGNIPFSVSGHTHVASYRLFDKGNHVCINTGSGKISYYPNNPYTPGSDYKYYHPVRYEDTYTEAMFDVITYSTDGVVKRISFGANCDNVFTPSDSGYTVTEQN